MPKTRPPYNAESRRRLVRKGRTPEEVGRPFEPSARRRIWLGRPMATPAGARTARRRPVSWRRLAAGAKTVPSAGREKRTARIW
jgi:hypothetical protein